MSSTSRVAPVVIALLLAAVGVAAVPVAVSATTAATITTSPDDPGAVATHRATVTVGTCEAGDSLNKIRVDYSVGSNPADVSNVSQTDVRAVGIDTDGDGTIDTDVSDDLSSVSASNNGHTLNLGFGGSYSLYENDTVVLEVADVTNPDTAGTYDVNVSLNYQSDPVCPSTASLTIERSPAAASITADPATAGSEAAHAVNRTVGSANQGTTLREFRVEYAATNASGLTAGDVTTAGLDTDADPGIEVDLRNDLSGVTVTDGGTTVTFSFAGNHTLSSGDRLVLDYGGVTNPGSAGDYTVTTVLGGEPVNATLSVDPAAEPNATVVADPATAGATAVHAATISVAANDVGDSLNKLRVDYSVGSNPADVSNVSQTDVRAVGIDTDGDGTIDTDVSDDLSSVSASNNGHTLDLGFGGSYSLGEGDTVVVRYADVANPDAAGTYAVDVSLNYQSDPVTTARASLSITQNTTENETSATVSLGMQSASIGATPSTAAVSGATHGVQVTVATGGPTATLQSVTVDYTTGADPADVGDFARSDVRVAGADTDGDGDADRTFTEAVEQVSTSNQGQTLTVTFDGSAALDQGETLVLRYEGVQNPAGDGTYDVAVALRAADQRVETVTSLRITTETDGATATPGGTTDGTAVAVSVDGENATAVIQNARRGSPVTVVLDRQPPKRGITFDGATLTFAEPTDATLRIAGDLDRPVDVTGPDLGNFEIRHGDLAISAATLRFSVANRTLAARDVAAGNVVLVRRHGGRWQVLETRVVGAGDGATRFAATAPGLSTFAVSTRPLTTASKPVFRVTGTDLTVETSERGKRIRVTATVRNVGREKGTFAARLTANGAVLANQSVTLAANESGRVTFAHTFSRAAVYDLAVSGTDAGVVEVEPRRTRASPTPLPGGDTPIPPVLLGLLGAVTLAAGAVWVTRMR